MTHESVPPPMASLSDAVTVRQRILLCGGCAAEDWFFEWKLEGSYEAGKYLEERGVLKAYDYVPEGWECKWSEDAEGFIYLCPTCQNDARRAEVTERARAEHEKWEAYFAECARAQKERDEEHAEAARRAAEERAQKKMEEQRELERLREAVNALEVENARLREQLASEAQHGLSLASAEGGELSYSPPHRSSMPPVRYISDTPCPGWLRRLAVWLGFSVAFQVGCATVEPAQCKKTCGAGSYAYRTDGCTCWCKPERGEEYYVAQRVAC